MLEPMSLDVNSTDPTKLKSKPNGEVYDVKPERPEPTSLSIDSTILLTLEKDTLIVIGKASLLMHRPV